MITQEKKMNEDLKIFDMDEAISALMLEKEDILEMATMYMDMIDADLQKLEGYAKDNNISEIQKTAHKIKGALQNFRFKRSGALAATIEKSAKENKTADYAKLTKELVALIKEAKEELEKF